MLKLLFGVATALVVIMAGSFTIIVKALLNEIKQEEKDND